MPNPTSGAVKSADRVLSLLEFLGERPGSSFKDIVAGLELPVSSAHQLLQTVLGRGFIELDPTLRTYRLGFRIWELAQTLEMADDIAALAQPYMEQLTDETLETVQLAVLDGLENVYLGISVSPHPMKLVSTVGSRLSAHATGLGKVLLGGLDDAELRRRLQGVTLEKFTDKTVVDPERLISEVQRTRTRGYGTDEEEYVIGCRCIAMPIRDGQGHIIAAMSVSIPTPRFTRTLSHEAREHLAATVHALEQRLGPTR